MRTVELRQAFLWTCDDCGRDNFERAVTCEVPPDLADVPEDIRYFLGDEGLWVEAPARVACGHCGARFETED